MEHVPLSPESEVGATREHVPLSPESEVGDKMAPPARQAREGAGTKRRVNITPPARQTQERECFRRKRRRRRHGYE